MVGMGERTDCARWVLSLFLVTKKLYAKETEWSRGQIKTCRKKQHVKIDVKIGVANLMCGKSAVGGNYNSTHDTKQIKLKFDQLLSSAYRQNGMDKIKPTV